MVAQGVAQLGDAPRGLTLDGAGAAAEYRGSVLDAQVLDVPQDDRRPHPGGQRGQGGEQVGVLRVGAPGCSGVG
jgi:hypothetical protein